MFPVFMTLVAIFCVIAFFVLIIGKCVGQVEYSWWMICLIPNGIAIGLVVGLYGPFLTLMWIFTWLK